jgi:hypothetical protein
MRRLKIAVVLAFTGVVALIPATAMAGSHAVVTVGSVASTSNNSLGHLASFVVTTPAAKSVTVNVNARTKLIGLSTAAVAAGLQSGDAVLASGGAGKH